MVGEATYPYRSEILFLYDIFRCNPNGDAYENRPRQDPLTRRVEVTDVRLKRTIRDYLLRYRDLPIFIEVPKEAVTAWERYEQVFGEPLKTGKEEEAKRKLIDKCVDVRLFGTLVPIKGRGEEVGGGIQITGPVQFNSGQSLHAVRVEEIKGTGGFASSEEKKQRTFRTEYIVPYALIGFYGTINEHWAEDSGLTEADVNLLMEAMWSGTASLHSRSKAFHHPRLLARMDYREERQCGYFLYKTQLRPKVEEELISSPRDYDVELGPWLKELERRRDYVERIYCRLDPDISLLKDGSPLNLREAFEGLVGKDRLAFIEM